MTIKVGDRIPSVTLKKMGEKGPENISTDEIFNGKKVVQALIEPPHASRDSPPDCRKRSAFDQLSYIHHSEPAIFLAPPKTCKHRLLRAIDSPPSLR